MDLEITQDERFQRREWVTERLGWSLVTAFVVAGFLGLLGAGPLSQASAAAGAVSVEHQRVTHYEADDSIAFAFGPEAVEGGAVTATLTGDWPGAVDVQGISPEPSEQRLVPGGLVLEFPVERSGDLEVSVSFRAQRLGYQDARLTVGPDSVTFAQLVLP